MDSSKRLNCKRSFHIRGNLKGLCSLCKLGCIYQFRNHGVKAVAKEIDFSVMDSSKRLNCKRSFRTRGNLLICKLG